MKILLEYDEVSGVVTGANGSIVTCFGLTGFPMPKNENSLTLDLIKQGITPDEIIKLKNNDLI